jgi:hypothetical protein
MSRLASLGRLMTVGLLALSLAGCAATGGAGRVVVYDAGPDPVLAQQSAAFNRTVVEGAAIGAAAGALIGALATRNRGQGALVGGIVGAVIGVAAGAAVAGEQQRFAAREDQLDALIGNARAQVGQLASIVRTTDRIIAERRRELSVSRSRGPGGGAIASRLGGDLHETNAVLNRAVQNRNALARNIQEYGGHPEAFAILNGYDNQINRLADNARRMEAIQREATR